MVGDGVNDAAALREADLGVAMHGGAELNATAADVQLARGGLSPLPELEAVASGATRAVRRNLVLSAIYNVVALSAAMAGIVTPLGAAIAMPLSSVAVVASSLAQRFRHKPSWMPVRARNGRPALAERSS
jgi:Cu2+-exporting ATPase